jgi:Ca2+-binding EF-hand superfamily protein
VVTVSIVGDITGVFGIPDGEVDMRDVGSVARLFGVSSPSPEYNPNFDINDDGTIDIKDVSTVARHFGENAP